MDVLCTVLTAFVVLYGAIWFAIKLPLAAMILLLFGIGCGGDD